MAKLTNTRILQIIPIFLIMVIFCPIANGKVICANDNVIHETNGSNPHFLQDAQVDTDNSLWPLQVGQVWVYIVTDSREPLSPWTMELHILEMVNIESSDYYHIGSYDLRADEWETGVVFINSDENFVYKWDEGEYSVWPRDEMVAEHVNVPYGRFDAVYYDEGDYYNYFVPGVGLVKTHQIEDEYTVTSELVDIHPPVPKTIIYVDDDAAGANDGSSWENAYTFLQEALADANDSKKPVEIRVAQGTYKPNEGLVAIPEFDWRTTTFQLINDVTIKGGYAGIGGEDPNARDIRIYETVLSGDLNGDYNPNFANNSENSYHVVTGSGTDDSAVLDGLTITAGNANYSSPDMRGGGMYNDSGNPTVTNCTFISNSAGDSGGGIYNGGGSNPTLTNCKFIRNWSIGGAGIYNLNSDPTLIDCMYTENSNVGDYIIEIQDLRGGTMFNENSEPNLINCTFKANQSIGMWNQASDPTLINCVFSANEGCGMLNRWSSPILTGCIFSGNFAQRGSGMCNSENSEPRIANSIFSGNTAVSEGGGIYDDEYSSTMLTNCTLTGNSAYSGGGIFSREPISVLINCILWNNSPDQITGLRTIRNSNIQGGVPGEGNIDVDPLFAKSGYWSAINDPNVAVEPNDPNAVWVDGDYHLMSQTGRWDPNSESWIKDDVTSPCIDAGDPNSDFSSETWPNGGRINMGAYGGTREASMSLDTGEMTLPKVAYIYSYNNHVAGSFESLLESYGCSTTSIRLNDVQEISLYPYDLIIVAEDNQYEEASNDPNIVAAIENSGKPVVGLGNGGYDFFGLLGLSIGNPYGGHGSKNSIKVVDPNSSLFNTPYSIEIPEDRALQLYTETNSIGIYLWPTVPETITVFGNEVDDAGYFPLVMQHNRYMLWGFSESPQKMTEVGKTLFINVVIRTANHPRESES